MEIRSKPHDPQNPPSLLSPTSPSLTSPTIPRSVSHPYPTTFVQADTSSFKEVVQFLTGSSKPDSLPPHPPPPPSSSSSSKSFTIPPVKMPPKKQGFKLYERRNNLKNSLIINTFTTNFPPHSGFSPRKLPEILSPSLLDFPSLSLSPVTPLNNDDDDSVALFEKSTLSPLLTATNTTSSSTASLSSLSEEEDRAIADKGFYLHPSPLTTPRGSEPRLLPLFPVSSPRVSESESPY